MKLDIQLKEMISKMEQFKRTIQDLNLKDKMRLEIERQIKVMEKDLDGAFKEKEVVIKTSDKKEFDLKQKQYQLLA